MAVIYAKLLRKEVYVSYLFTLPIICHLGMGGLNGQELNVTITPEHETKVKKELKGMGYTSIRLRKKYHIKKCPDGHLGFVIPFTGTQFGAHKRSGYFCPPYINQSVVYQGEKL